jgi:Cytochrome c554 and c-prime
MAGWKHRRLLSLSGALALIMAFSAATPSIGAAPSGSAKTVQGGVHEGVGSCAQSMCHGRQVASGLVVRQNELITWQDPNSQAGDHSRAWRALASPRGQAIADRLGLGPAQAAPLCLGCHADPAPARLRGARFQISDGVGCEACHGGSSGWLASHRDVGATHADNVARGMTALEDPKVRAAVCLDCHFGGSATDQFVSHRIMSAGHPRLSFELDLFSTLQRHYDLNAGYARRKTIAGGVKIWGVGQAMALERSLTLYGDPRRGQDGTFPEFYFFDCHSCHRAISDDPKARPAALVNPGRPIPNGEPPFNDENMIMLSALAKIAAPELSGAFETNSRAFHAALATDRTGAIRAARKLAASARALSGAFAARSFSRADTIAILGQVVSDAQAMRYTDYTGCAQAVMAIDTLLNALVDAHQVDVSTAAAMRPDIDRAYHAVLDPNAYRPAEFRASIQRIASTVGSLPR